MLHTKYIWDPLSDNVLMEKDGNGATTAVNTYLPEQYGDQISQRRDGETSYYHFDGQGSTRALTDESENVTDTYAYTAFGEVLSHTGTTTNPFGYGGALGYYANPETNDYYVRARNYEPTIARWLSADPARFVDGMNLYAYAGNDPGNKVDSSGLQVAPPIIPGTEGGCGKCCEVSSMSFVVSPERAKCGVGTILKTGKKGFVAQFNVLSAGPVLISGDFFRVVSPVLRCRWFVSPMVRVF